MSAAAASVSPTAGASAAGGSAVAPAPAAGGKTDDLFAFLDKEALQV